PGDLTDVARDADADGPLARRVRHRDVGVARHAGAPGRRVRDGDGRRPGRQGERHARRQVIVKGHWRPVVVIIYGIRTAGEDHRRGGVTLDGLRTGEFEN